MATTESHSVRIDAPTANKVVAFAAAAVSVFITLVFITNVDALLFQAAMVAAAGLAGGYAYRTARTDAIADRDGITIRNLRSSSSIPWAEVDHLAVTKLDHDQGTGIEVVTITGTRHPIEASWGPWYRPSRADANTKRCESLIHDIGVLRTEAGHGSHDDHVLPELDIHWLTAFVDLPAGSWDQGIEFWTRATRSTLSDLRGEHDEFATLVPPDGSPYLKLQRIGGDRSRVHLDVHVSSIAEAVTRAEALGATVIADPHHVVMRSPAGFTFCFVDERLDGGVPSPEDSATPNRVDQVSIDVPAELYDRECTFWAALTGWRIRKGPRVELRLLERPDDIPLRLVLQRLGREDHRGTASAHLDFGCGEDLTELLMRHDRYDARRIANKGAWIVMEDPTGLPYCLTNRNPLPGRLSG